MFETVRRGHRSSIITQRKEEPTEYEAQPNLEKSSSISDADEAVRMAVRHGETAYEGLDLITACSVTAHVQQSVYPDPAGLVSHT